MMGGTNMAAAGAGRLTGSACTPFTRTMVLGLVLGSLAWGGAARAQNDCFRDPNSPTGCNNFCPSGQDCLPSAYGCNVNQPGTCGVQACDCNCHIAFDAASQPFCQGACPDGTGCQLIGNGSSHAPYECTCDPTLCPVAQEIWCQNLQATDCAGGQPGEGCWVTNAGITATGAPAINSCGCVDVGCGKMDVQTFADGTFAYRCLDQCQNTSQPCVIYQNNVATTSGAIHSSQIAPGDDIRCGCKQPPPLVCPLETGTKICESVQAVDCQATGTGDLCRPDVVIIGPNGQVEGKRCDCFPQDATCGPVLVIDLPAPNGTQISCDVNCPDPAVEQCHIYRNGFSTGLISAPASIFAPGDELACGCDPIQEPVCPLPPTPWCQNLQNLNCRDGQPGEQCEPTLVTIGFTGDIDICACDCVANACQEVTITPDPTGYTLSCDNECLNADQQCVIFMNGAQTNLTSIHSSQALGQYISCDCADNPPLCPLGAGQSWCAARQSLDCHNGAAGDQCWPVTASIDTTGNPVIEECGCTPGGCGKMAVTTFADGTFAYRCLDTCPDPTQPCVIYKNNVATSSASIHSSQFAPGDDIRCDCKDTPKVCPLQTFTKVCEQFQAVDCQSTTPGDVCKPDVVVIGPNFQVLGKRCTCYPDDATCGPIWIIELPPSQGGTQVSCDVACPDPAVEECHIYRNGFSTGVISAPVTAFNPGDELTCGCDPIDSVLCPLTPIPWCQNLQNLMCRDGLPGQECVPTAVTVDFAGGIDLCGCDCLRNECQEVTITPDPAGYTLSCDNSCPSPDLQCVIFINGTQTNLTSIHTSQALGQYINCDCAQPTLGACCYIDSTGVTACASNVTAAWCAAVGGTFHLSATCTGNQACCKPDGTCEDLDPLCCADAGGVSQGAGTSCGTPGICGQVCDLPPPPEQPWCANRQPIDCQDGAAGELCKPIEVFTTPVGALKMGECDCVTDECRSLSIIGDAAGWTIRCDNQCTDPADACVIHVDGFATTMTSIHTSMIGPYKKITCDCAHAPLLGACCYYDAAAAAWNCQDGITSADCDALGGVFHPGQNCTGMMGCCLPDGTCQNMDPLCCEDAGGITLPAGAICTGVTEACCNPLTNTCTDEERACCMAHGGIPQGVGTNCAMPGICGGDICPLAQGSFGTWCNNFQTTDCVNGKDTEECWPWVVTATATGFPQVVACDCMEHCGPVTIAEVGGTYQFHCEHQCETPGFECVIHYDGVNQGLHAVNATDVTPGTKVTCDCAPDPPKYCELPPNQPWCANRQPLDCPQSTDFEKCLPEVVSMTTAGGLNVEQCACMQFECGRVLISEQPDGYLFRCPQPCDTDPDKECVIHFNGVPQGITYVHSNAVPANVDVTCDCAEIEVGMCCYRDAAGGYTCVDNVTQAVCNDLGGTFHPNVSCTDAIIPCCLPDGTCQDLHPLCCQDFGGTPNFNATCTGQTVACCDPATNVCQNMDSACCATPVAGALCTGNTVACCFQDGTCADLEVPCCLAAGGSPQAAGTDCTMANVCGGDTCDLPQNDPPWCDARLPIDCQGGTTPPEECQPKYVSVTATGGLDIVQCDCQDGLCGPVTIKPVASGYIFRCTRPCPNTGEKCRIFRNDVATNVSAVHSSTVAPGEKISCDCVGTPILCPLDPQLDICLERQQIDCQGTATENCKAKVVSFDTAGNPQAKLCDCFANDGKCGPVLLFPAPPPQGGWNISCDQACPPGQQCVIWRGNSPTGLISAHSSMFGPNEDLSCDCLPVQPVCKPTPDGQACTPCPDPTLKCVPTLIDWNPVVPGYRILECACTNKCHINPPPAVGGEPVCSDACPGGPITLPKKCVKKQDPATGAWMCRCVPFLPDLDPADPALRKNRYLSMSPGGALGRGLDEGPIGGVRLTLDDLMNPQPANSPGQNPPDFSAYEGEHRWAGTINEFQADIFGNTFFAASLSCEPMFTDYSVIGEFSIYGAEVLPSSAYTIQTVSEECAESLDEEDCYSAGSVVGTGRWGDVSAPFQNPAGPLNQPNAVDIARVVDVVKAVPGAIHKTLAQMAPNVPAPDRAANAIDIAETVDAVKGRAYHQSGPCECPSAVVCNPGTVCVTNGDCTAPATCINGYCSTAKDACNRCSAP